MPRMVKGLDIRSLVTRHQMPDLGDGTHPPRGACTSCGMFYESYWFKRSKRKISHSIC